MIQYNRIENALTFLLIVAFFILILDLAVSKGMYKICITFIKIIVSLQLLRVFFLYFTKKSTLFFTKGLLIAIAIPIILILLDLLSIDGISERYYIKNLKTAIFIILAIWMMPFEFKKNNSKLFFYSLLVLLLMASSANFIAVIVFSLHKFGLTSNPHYLALQAIIVIPISLYLLRFCPLIGKTIIASIVLMEFYLLMDSYSRTAWLAFIIASLICIPFLRFKARLWAASIIFFVPISVYYLGVLGIDDRLNDLIANLSKEERVTIWSDAIAMQQNSNLYQWLVGHGLGGFEQGFQTYSKYHGEVDFTTPHNFFIEVLYTSGLIGSLAIAIGECVFIYTLLRLWWKTSFDSQKVVILLIFVLFTTHFIHTFLTISFFTKQSIYFLSMLIGLGCYVMRRESFLINRE